MVKPGTPAEFAGWLKSATERWGGIIRDSGIKGTN